MTVIRLPSMVMGAPAPRWISRRSAAEDAVICHSSTQAARLSRTTRSISSISPQPVTFGMAAPFPRVSRAARGVEEGPRGPVSRGALGAPF